MDLRDDTFILYAAKHYENPSITTLAEFREDVKRFTNLKKLFRKYKKDGVLNDRLILNHIIILYNVFSPECCTNMLKHKLSDYLPELKPFLVFLHYWPTKADGVMMDENIIKILRKFKNE